MTKFFFKFKKPYFWPISPLFCFILFIFFGGGGEGGEGLVLTKPKNRFSKKLKRG